MEYTYVDFTEYNFSKKLRKLRHADTYDKVVKANYTTVNKFKLSNIVMSLIEATRGEISSQTMIRNIAKKQFQTGQIFFLYDMLFFLIFYMAPLFWQFFETDAQWTRIC